MAVLVKRHNKTNPETELYVKATLDALARNYGRLSVYQVPNIDRMHHSSDMSGYPDKMVNALEKLLTQTVLV